LTEIDAMSSLRLVPGQQAGPDALGILVPPGARTVLIVRPRALAWDLLLVRGPADTAFRDLGRDEAPAVAREFLAALERWCCGSAGHVEAVTASQGEGSLVWVDVGDFCLVVCARVPGKPYQPLLFTQTDEARRAARCIASILHPPAGAEQEVYFNTHHFAR
jgi:hypothetical protein